MNPLLEVLHTWLSKHDFSGKTVAPFITHEGAGLGKSSSDLARLCPGGAVLEGLAVRGGKVNGVQLEVAKWLRKIGLGK